MALTSFFVLLTLVSPIVSENCAISYCCYNQISSFPVPPNSCSQLTNICGEVCNTQDENTPIVVNLAETGSKKNEDLSSVDMALIVIGVVAVVAIVGVGAYSWHSKSRFESDNDSEDEAEPAEKERSGFLTAMTTMSCVLAVVALSVAIVALTGERTQGHSDSTVNVNTEMLQAVAANKMQLTTGPYKVTSSSLIPQHSYCQKNMSYWRACAKMQRDIEAIVDMMAVKQGNISQMQQTVVVGDAGERAFVAVDGAFTAVSPTLTSLKSHLNQPHGLANTSLCMNSPSGKICVIEHLNHETSQSVFVAYITYSTSQTNATRHTRTLTTAVAGTIADLTGTSTTGNTVSYADFKDAQTQTC